jgi:hypothetical protein
MQERLQILSNMQEICRMQKTCINAVRREK